MVMLIILEARWLNLAGNEIEKLDFDQLNPSSCPSCETFNLWGVAAFLDKNLSPFGCERK